MARIRCKYLDCAFWMKTIAVQLIELVSNKGCLTYSPVANSIEDDWEEPMKQKIGRIWKKRTMIKKMILDEDEEGVLTDPKMNDKTDSQLSGFLLAFIHR